MAKESASRPKSTPAVKRPAAPAGDGDTLEGTVVPRPAPKKPALDQTAAFDPEEHDLSGAEEQAAHETEVGDDHEEAIDPNEQTQAMEEGAGKASGIKATTMGDYRLLKKLGQGGMGAVFKAHQISLDREVAVKVLSKELSAKPAFVARFEREAKVMAKLDHPNILRCFGVGTSMGYHYISMEFVEGGSVENWLKKFKKFSLGDALHILIVVSRALDHAHELKMIHRDVKPDNILITKKGVLKVADLGLAKAQDDDMSLTKTGTGAGTPIYMAPEQARDAKHVDHRTDIYALGCMLYVFLTGEPPFKGETLVELIEAKEKGKFKPMRTFDASIPERLDLIVDKMLAKKPELRYASCAELSDELEALGLANDALSFFGGAVAAGGAGGSAARGSKSSPGRSSVPAAKKPSQAPRPPAEEPEEEETEAAAFWHVQFVNAKGKAFTKRVEQEELETLIRSGSIDATAKVSRQPDKGFRAVGSIREFEPLFRTKQVRAKADKGASNFKSLVDKYDKQDKSRRFWKKVRATVGPIVVWLIVLGALGAAAWFGYKFAVEAGYLK